MAGFIDAVSESFFSRRPEGRDRKASARVEVKVGRKLLESLVEVGLREAFADKFTLRRLELVELHTVSNRRARVIAHVAATKFVDVDLKLTASIELREKVGDGLRLYFHEIEATGRGGFLDWLGSVAAHYFALNDLGKSEITIDSVRLRGGRVKDLEISGHDPVRILVSLRDADTTAIF